MFEESQQEQIMSAFRLITPSLQEACEYEKFLQLIQRLRNIPQIIEFSLKHRNLINQDWYVEVMSQPIQFNLPNHIEQTKIILDLFIQKHVEHSNSDQIITGHRKLSSLLNQVYMIDYQQFKKVVQQKDHVEEQKLRTSDCYQLTPLEVAHKPTRLNSIEQIQRTYVEKSGEFKEDLENEIIDLSQRMKSIAQNIQVQLISDMTLLKKIESKQDTNLTQVQSGKSRIDKFMKSKSLSCSTLFFMLVISISLTVFCLIFIKIF